MVNMSLVRMKSNGQIIIPKALREDLKAGKELVVINDDESFILKKTEKISEKMKEDLEFAQRTEEAYQRIQAGDYTSVDSEKLIDEMSKW